MTAEAINSKIAASATDEQIGLRLSSAFDAVARSYKAAGWPSPAHFVEAMDKTAPQDAPQAIQDEVVDFSLTPRRRRFLNLYRDGPKYVIRPDEDEASRKGRMCREEWRHHVTVMSRLTGNDYGYQEAIERAALSEGELPE